MAFTTAVSHGVSNPNRGPYLIQRTIDFAVETTAKGSALAAADVIPGLLVPANHIVLMGGAQVMEAMAGTSTDLTLDIGFTGGNVDWVADGFDYDGAALNDYTAPVIAELPIQIDAAGTNNSLDVLIKTQTGTFTGGKLRIFAYVMDASNIDDEDGMPGAVARDVA
jgi:hypothetical protein